MVNVQTIVEWAMELPNTSEQPHFDKLSYRVKKKIFLTVNQAEQRCTVKLSEIDQDVFSKGSNGSISPVPNAWGKQGWTNIDLTMVHPDLCRDAIRTSYTEVSGIILD